MVEATWKRGLRWFFLPLTLAALAWTVWLLWDSWPALRRSLPDLRYGWLILTLLGSTISGYLGFEAFRALFNQVCPGTYRRSSLAHLYFTGQLMKHLPGRVWGLAYQSVSGHQATLAEWFSVSVMFMMLASFFALAVSGTVLGFALDWRRGVAVLAIGLGVYFLGWNRRALLVLLDFLGKLPSRAVRRIADALRAFADVDPPFKLRILCWFVANWLIYLISWAGYGLAWPGLTISDGVWLCALYTLAWFVGYVSLISPSGIGVRELVFVLLAHRFPPDAVAGMAVLGRFMLLVVDVILGIVFVPFRARERTGGN